MPRCSLRLADINDGERQRVAQNVGRHTSKLFLSAHGSPHWLITIGIRDALAEMDIENPEPQTASPPRTQTRSSRATGSPTKASANEPIEANLNMPTPELGRLHVDGLVPAAMGADSPMTDVDSIV